MVRANGAMFGKNLAGEGPKTPFHAVADNRIADLAADRESHAPLRVAILAIPDEQDEGVRRGPPADVGSQEIASFA